MKRTLALAVSLAALWAAGSAALDHHKAASAKPAHVMENESDLQWADAPWLPPGAKISVLQGDPSKAQMFTARLRIPDGYKIPAHWHPMTENLTIISGTFNLGMGDTFDQTKTTALSAGGFARMPAKMHHFAWAKGETEVQAHGMGPFTMIYVNPEEDPAQAAKN